MIDTIRLRFHGINDVYDSTIKIIEAETSGTSLMVVPEHQALFVAMMKKKGKYFNKVTTHNEEKLVAETIDDGNTTEIKYYHNHNVITFQDGEKIKKQNMKVNGTYRIPSSDSNVSYTINEKGSYIDFEFSIPKYLYGHNFAQFIPQGGSRKAYLSNEKHLWSYQVKHLHSRLTEFIDKFCTDLCLTYELDMMPNKDYIELRRIDLCYNQYFDSKQDALLYLEYQRKFNNKRQKKNANTSKSYDTAITYFNSKGSYFKIYHKGSEFSKNKGDIDKFMKANAKYIDSLPKGIDHDVIYKKDRKYLHSIFEQYAKGNPVNLDSNFKDKVKNTVNAMGRKYPFKVHFLKDEMDKILRYEVSLKGQFLNHLYKDKVFRRNDEVHLFYQKLYKEVKNAFKRKDFEKNKVDKWKLRHYKHYHKWAQRSVSLLFSTNHQIKRREKTSVYDYDTLKKSYRISSFNYKKTILSGKDVGTFSDFVLRQCCKHFKSIIEHYQVQEIDSFDDIAKRINEYNSKAKEKIKEYNVLNQIKLFDQWGNRKIKSGKEVKNPVDLLTYDKRRELGLKTVHAPMLLMLLKQIEGGTTLDAYAKEYNLTSSTYHRYKKQLELFGVFHNSVRTKKALIVKTDFYQYYNLTSRIDYSNKFYSNQLMYRYK